VLREKEKLLCETRRNFFFFAQLLRKKYTKESVQKICKITARFQTDPPKFFLLCHRDIESG